MESLGPKIRRLRRRMALTLDELAAKTAISKPYLSLIETERVPNPPSDEKLKRIEAALGLPAGELVMQAHLQRTPKDVREMLERLVGLEAGTKRESDCGLRIADCGLKTAKSTVDRSSVHSNPKSEIRNPQSPAPTTAPDLARLLREQLLSSPARPGVRSGMAPVINRVSAGYPRDFVDMGYPPRVADEYVSCPGLDDPAAFAARVSGDSMSPRYREGDVVVFSPAAEWHDGDDCFVRFGTGETTFKRVFMEKSPQGVPVLRLQPRNQRYGPQVVPSDKIMGLHKATHQLRRVDRQEEE